MDIESILQGLKEERDRLDQAINALEGHSGRRGRPVGRKSANGRRRRRRLSAEVKKRVSEAAKARWARAKRAGRSRL